jgi:hypothetical protein
MFSDLCVHVFFRDPEQRLPQLLESLERREGTGRVGFCHVSTLRPHPAQSEVAHVRVCLVSADVQLRASASAVFPVKCRYVSRFPVMPCITPSNRSPSVALHLAHYNLVRIHQTLRCTPAMAAGVTDRLWDLTHIVQIVDDWESAQKSDQGVN